MAMRRARSRLFTAVCVVVLLFAQFSALTHAAWHAHADIHVYDHAHDHAGGANGSGNDAPDAHEGHDRHDSEHPSGEAALCAFHLAFGQVLGGVHACSVPTLTLLQGVESILDVPASRLHAEALSPKSRGPPILL